jgi:hypothetical protein
MIPYICVLAPTHYLSKFYEFHCSLIVYIQINLTVVTYVSEKHKVTSFSFPLNWLPDLLDSYCS